MCFPVGKSSRCRFVGTPDGVCHDLVKKHPACGVDAFLEFNEAVGFDPDDISQAEVEGRVPCPRCFS